MERHILDWLNVIADDTIRESAIEQWNKKREQAESLDDAINRFAAWMKTIEGWDYWDIIFIQAQENKLKLRTYTAPNGDYFDGKEWVIVFKFKGIVLPQKLDFSEDDVSWNDDKAIEHAILLLESKGYKVTKNEKA